MSQHDFNIANQSFPATRTDLNNALQALASNSSGDAEPSTTFANQWWYETDTNTLKLRNEANSAWLSFATVDQTTGAVSLLYSGSAKITSTSTGIEVVGVILAQGAVLDGTGAITVPVGTEAQRPTASTGQLRFNSDAASFEGYDGSAWGSIGGQAPSLFAKADATAVAWTKTGAGTAETQTIVYAEVNGVVITVASGTSITMPTLTAGTDYAIWLETDGGLTATTDHTSPPTANARKIGGFHYAAGGNAPAQAGGDTTPAINAYSFWDLNFRPTCPDPRGMTLVGDGFWVDIYLSGVDAITNGSSKYNVTIADGSSPPKVPTMFGGDGTTTYGTYTWFEAQELATAFGKYTLTQLEFMSAMYGTTEASSIGTDPSTTNWDAAYVSKWGVNQATGCMYVWGRDRGGPAAAASWNANTEGRGSEYNAPNAVIFGDNYSSGSNSGSRCSYWGVAASFSNGNIGSRFACDHLQLG